MNGHSTPRDSKTKGRRWRALVFVDAEHGGPRRECHGTFPRKCDADAKVVKVLDAYHRGTYRKPSRLTVAVVVDRWLRQHVAQLEPLTRQNYQRICDHFILPRFGDEFAEMVAPADVSKWLAKLLKDGRLDGRGGMSPKYVRQVRFIMHTAYAHSVKHGEIARNPIDAVHGPSVPKRQFDPPSMGRMREAMDALKGTRYYVPMAIAAATGMRRGEVLGLSWRHIDLDAATVRVRRQLIETAEGISLTTPKTDAAFRELRLPPFVVAVLQQEMERQKVTAQIAGLAWSPDAYVCPNTGGGPIMPDKFSRGFTAVLRRRGLEPFRFHDMRHAVATEMLELGERADVVQRQLGHATVAITLGIYAHVRPGMLNEAMARYGKRWEEAAEPAPAAEPEDGRQTGNIPGEVLDMSEARRRKRPA